MRKRLDQDFPRGPKCNESFTMKLTTAQRQRIKAEAVARKTTQSRLVRVAIKQFISTPPDKTAPSDREIVRNLAALRTGLVQVRITLRHIARVADNINEIVDQDTMRSALADLFEIRQQIADAVLRIRSE